MIEPLEHAYFNWLYSKVCNVRTTAKSQQFETLLQELHRTQFPWLLSGDDNREEEGRVLRDEFITTSLAEAPEEWFDEGCSVLEMLIAFSRRAADQTGDEAKTWFWIMLDNLGLADLSDNKNPDRTRIREILDIFIWRTYDERGHGGLFPLRETEYDQRYIELSYQLSEYLYQNNIV